VEIFRRHASQHGLQGISRPFQEQNIAVGYDIDAASFRQAEPLDIRARDAHRKTVSPSRKSRSHGEGLLAGLYNEYTPESIDCKPCPTIPARGTAGPHHLAFEAGQASTGAADAEEVSNHLAALAHARAELAKPAGLPLSLRLLNEAHRRLMQGARGSGKQPGEIRRSQNWIGGSRPGNAAFVPPPPNALAGALSALEKYIHARDKLPPLIRIALLHVQFETIHPYLDGNRRIGR
jgi:hypothetical protein